MSPSSSPKRARYYTGIRLSPWIALALTACGPVLIGLGAGGAGGGGGGGTSPDATVPVADQVRLRVEPATNRVVHLDVLPPKTGGTLSCKVVDSTSGLISVDALDAASGSRVVRFEKDIISTLVVPIPERFLGGTSQLRVTATYDGNFYKTGVETKNLPLGATEADRRDIELAPAIAEETNSTWELNLQWAPAPGDLPSTELIYGPDALQVEGSASRNSDAGVTIRKIAVDRMHPAFQVTIPTVNSALYVAVRDTLGRRSRVVHWVPPSSSNLSLAQESLTFQFPVPPALDLPVLMEPAGASDSAPFVSSIEKPGNASYQRSWSLQGSMLFEKGARELTNGPPAIALLQRAAGPYTPPPVAGMDIAVATGATVKLVNSAGTSTPVLSATPLPLTDAILGDFDGDGLTDLLATQADRLFAVGDLWSTPATPSQHLWLTTSTDRQLRVGDIDGRGADFVVSPTTSALEVLVLTTGSGSPSFSSIASGAPLQWKSASFVDINQDDLLDLLVIEDSSPQIKLVAFECSSNNNPELKERILADVAPGTNPSMLMLVDLDGDGAQELVWRRPDNALHVWKGRMAPGGSRQDWSGLFPAEAPLPRLFDVSQPNLPPPLPTPLRTTPMAVGDTNSDGLPDLVSMDETGVSLSIVRPSTDLGKFAGQAKLLGSVTLENSTAPAWLGDHLVVVQGGNQLVFLDPWSGSPPRSLTGSAINEIATGSQFGKGSILYRRANGTAGTITVDDNGAVAHETWNSIGTIGVDVTRLLPSPRLDRNRKVDLLWQTSNGVTGRLNDQGQTNVGRLDATVVAIGDIDGDGLTDILRCDGANVSVTRWLPAPQPQQGTWQSTLVPIDAADVKAMAILPARGLLARFALAKGSSNTTQVVKMTTNLATPSPTATDTWTVSVQPNDVRGVLPLSEAGQDLLFLHTNDGVWALNNDPSHTTTKVLDGNFVGFEFAALGGDDGKDLVSWRKIDTKTVIEYWLLPRTTTPQ